MGQVILEMRAEMHICLRVNCAILTKIGIAMSTTLTKFPKIKFNESSFSCSQIVTCGQTLRSERAHFFMRPL
jgi:uncharacterized membrane protein